MTKLLTYLPTLIQDDDSDWIYILILLRKKLQCMAKRFELTNYYGEIKFAIKLLDFLIDRDYNSITYHPSYVNLKNIKRFIPEFEESKVKSFERQAIYTKLYYRKIWHLFWFYMERKSFRWF